MSIGTEMEPIPTQKYQPEHMPGGGGGVWLGQDLGFEVLMIPAESGGWL